MGGGGRCKANSCIYKETSLIGEGGEEPNCEVCGLKNHVQSGSTLIGKVVNWTTASG